MGFFLRCLCLILFEGLPVLVLPFDSTICRPAQDDTCGRRGRFEDMILSENVVRTFRYDDPLRQKVLSQRGQKLVN